MPSTSREANEGCWVTGWGTPGPTLGNEREERESPRRKPWEVLYILCILNKKYSHSSRTSASLHPPPPYLFQWVRSCFPESCAHSGRPPSQAGLVLQNLTTPRRGRAPFWKRQQETSRKDTWVWLLFIPLNSGNKERLPCNSLPCP